MNVLKDVSIENIHLNLSEELSSAKSFLNYLPSVTFQENNFALRISGGIPASFILEHCDQSSTTLRFDTSISDPRLSFAFRLSKANLLFQLLPLAHSLPFPLSPKVSWSAYFAKAKSESLFPSHVDDHDVFVFQLFGERIWSIDNKIYHLLPGHLLKIPKGIEHEVVETLFDSLHITVGRHFSLD